jgi:hypothetical protein
MIVKKIHQPKTEKIEAERGRMVKEQDFQYNF